MSDLPDVVIVGGGIVGACAAYELARRSYRVTLLDARRPASGATSGGFAWINATAKTDDETYHRLNAQGVALYDAFAAEFSAERIGLHAGGALSWTNGEDEAGRMRLRRQAARLQSWGYPAVLLSRSEIVALEPGAQVPDEAAEGLFAPADKWLDTARWVRFLLDQVRERGGDIREYCPANGFTRTPAQAVSTVETSQGRIATRLVILAAGVQTPALAALLLPDAPEGSLPVQQLPGLLVETPPGSAPRLIERVLYPPDAGGLHLRPTPGGGLLAGAQDTDALADVNGRFPADAPRQLLERAAAVFPSLPLDSLVSQASARVCVRPIPGDERPIVGALPNLLGVYVAVTHSGVTLGPLLARLLVEEIVTGRVPTLLEPYRPDRFWKEGA